jgi:hypothetical protein
MASHVGQQVTQPERGVNVFGVKRAKDDLWRWRHPAILTSLWQKALAGAD